SELQQRVDELNRQLAAERARNAANERNLNEMRRLLGDLCSRLETLNMSMQGGGNQPTQPANVSQYGAQSIQPQQLPNASKQLNALSDSDSDSAPKIKRAHQNRNHPFNQ